MLISLASLLVPTTLCVRPSAFKRTVDGYTNSGSCVFVSCFFYFSKAFDEVSYRKLFQQVAQLLRRDRATHELL